MKVLFLTISLAVIVAVSATPTPEDKDKPWDCPKNEKYYKCASEECFKECKHLFSFPACPQLAPGCYEPACLCAEGFLRDDEGDCVPQQLCLLGDFQMN